jgi:hypothetical protein
MLWQFHSFIWGLFSIYYVPDQVLGTGVWQKTRDKVFTLKELVQKCPKMAPPKRREVSELKGKLRGRCDGWNCNPNSEGREIRKMVVQGQFKQKVPRDPHLNQWLDAMAHTCHPSFVGKHTQEDCGPGWPGHKMRPYLKNSQCKKG